LPFCHITLTAPKPSISAFPKSIRLRRTIGDHLRKRRLDLDLLQKDVAEIIGVTEVTISNWENNKNKPPSRYLKKIIDFLGYHIRN